MRKGFTEENSKEMEVVLKIRVPVDFDRDMESKIDVALADVMFDFGCEMIEVGEYRDVGGEGERPRSGHFGMEDMRAMIREEIAQNGVEIYGLTGEEAEEMLRDVDSIDILAEYMDQALYRVDGNAYRALEIVFEQNFCDVLDDFREARIETMTEGLGLFYDASIHGSTLFVDCWRGDSVEIFLADDGGLMCLLPDEDEARALREKIQDVEPGDAFFFGGGGSIRTSSEAAHQNFDEPDNPWILYGDDGECYFEEDFGRELFVNVREILGKLPAREQEEYPEPAEYPLKHYDDAVRHLCEALNDHDEEMDLDDNFTPIKSDEFVPIFKSENYFGIYCWHDDANEYYLIDRNNGTHTMVLGDSFEFVGKNTLDCMKDETILNVANTEWLHYLVEFSQQNVQGVVPEQELRGIAVLEAALREAVKKEGRFFMGPSLMEKLEAAQRSCDSSAQSAGVVRDSGLVVRDGMDK